jgi:hypothetical protein
MRLTHMRFVHEAAQSREETLKDEASEHIEAAGLVCVGSGMGNATALSAGVPFPPLAMSVSPVAKGRHFLLRHRLARPLTTPAIHQGMG